MISYTFDETSQVSPAIYWSDNVCLARIPLPYFEQMLTERRLSKSDKEELTFCHTIKDGVVYVFLSSRLQKLVEHERVWFPCVHQYGERKIKLNRLPVVSALVEFGDLIEGGEGKPGNFYVRGLLGDKTEDKGIFFSVEVSDELIGAVEYFYSMMV